MTTTDDTTQPDHTPTPQEPQTQDQETPTPEEHKEEQEEQPEDPRLTQARSRAHKASKEAAAYRVKAKRAEEATQVLQDRYDGLLRSVIETHLPSHMPAAVFWKFVDDDLTNYIGDDGLTVNSQAVQDRATSLTEELGLKPTPRGPIVPNIADTPNTEPNFGDWHQVIHNR